MNIYFLPILLSGILCSLLSLITWMFRRRESINRYFSLFTLALAVDSFAFFTWYQFGSVETIHTWVPILFTAGFLVPTALIIFFFAFTGYNERPDEKVLGLKTGHVYRGLLVFVGTCLLVSHFTSLMIRIPEAPRDLWDVDLGPLGNLMFPLYLLVFGYLYGMVFKAYRTSESHPQKRFILLLSAGTAAWLAFGYGGAIFFHTSSMLWQALSYTGTTTMAVFYFVALLKYQSDKLHELNLGLEQKVEERTRHLEETRLQLIQSEKMAALGHLVAGVAHEMNSPIGAMYSTHNTLESATRKLKQTLEQEAGVDVGGSPRLTSILAAMDGASRVIRNSSERVTGIVKRMKAFARLDEASLQTVDLTECIENTLEMFRFHLKPDISVRTEFAHLPNVTCYPAEINQLCYHLLTNANAAIDGPGEIALRTEHESGTIRFTVSDTGRGIDPEHLDRIFDPGFTAWDLKVGTGLGLAICYQVAELHSGSIAVDSSPGEGSTFTFSLPIPRQ